MTWTKEQFREKFEELKRQFGNKCSTEGCDSDKLDFAHIKDTKLSGSGRGSLHRYYDIKKHPDCYALMCKKHHRIYDDRKLIQ